MPINHSVGDKLVLKPLKLLPLHMDFKSVDGSNELKHYSQVVNQVCVSADRKPDECVKQVLLGESYQ